MRNHESGCQERLDNRLLGQKAERLFFIAYVVKLRW